MHNLDANTMIVPFKDITSYLMALIIIHKMYCIKKNNTQVVHHCFKRFINNCTLIQTETLITLIHQYKHQYRHPFSFLINIDKFTSEINNYCIENNEASTIIDIEIEKCSYCQNDNPYWYTYKSPKFTKKAILYRINGIGKYIY
jgi:hypothetical protein